MSEFDLRVLLDNAGGGLYAGMSADVSLSAPQTIATGAPQTVLHDVVNNDDLGFTGVGAPAGGFIIPTFAPEPEIQAIQLTIRCLWAANVATARTVGTFPLLNTGIADTDPNAGNAITGLARTCVSGPIRVTPGDTFTMIASHNDAGNIDLTLSHFGIIVLR